MSKSLKSQIRDCILGHQSSELFGNQICREVWVEVRIKTCNQVRDQGNTDLWIKVWRKICNQVMELPDHE